MEYEYNVLPQPPESKGFFSDKRIIIMSVIIVILIVIIGFLVFHIYAQPVAPPGNAGNGVGNPAQPAVPAPQAPQATEHERVVASTPNDEIAKYANLTDHDAGNKSAEDEDDLLERELSE